MASLRLHAIRVTEDEVADLDESVRSLGHEVAIGPPSWEGSGGASGNTYVVEWYGDRLRGKEADEIVEVTMDWGRLHWRDRWRPHRLGQITAGRVWRTIPFEDEPS